MCIYRRPKSNITYNNNITIRPSKRTFQNSFIRISKTKRQEKYQSNRTQIFNTQYQVTHRLSSHAILSNVVRRLRTCF